MRELAFIRSGRLAWRDRDAPILNDPGDAIVRPFVAARCDGDTLPIHRPVSRVMQAGIAVRVIDPIVGCICGRVPFRGPFAIGHECVAQVVAVGRGVRARPRRSDRRRAVGGLVRRVRALPARPDLQVRDDDQRRTLAAYGFGPASGPWGGMVTDEIRVPFADHMLVAVPADVPPARVAAASDNLADAWRSVVPPLRDRPGGSVLIIGGGAQSIGLYAAGLAVAHGAGVVHYVDDDPGRRRIAEAFGAHASAARTARARRRATTLRYDVVVEASSRAAGPAPRRPVARPRRRLHRRRLLPRHGNAGAAHVHVRDRRDAARRRLACARRPPGPARLRRAHPFPRRAGDDPHGGLGRRAHRVRGTNDEARPPARRHLDDA